MGQSFGLVLKGNFNSFYANTILKSAKADVCLPTADEGILFCQTPPASARARRWSASPPPPLGILESIKANTWSVDYNLAFHCIVIALKAPTPQRFCSTRLCTGGLGKVALPP